MSSPPPGLIRLLALIRKELLQSFRDVRVVWILVGVPVLQLVLFGYVVDLDVDRVPTALCDLDRSARSRELAALLFADRTFVQTGAEAEPEQALRMLERGTAAVAVIFPRGLGERLEREAPAEVQVVVDGTDPVRARVAMGAAEQLFGARALSLALGRLAAASARLGRAAAVPRVELLPRTYYNPALKSRIYMVPGVLASVLLIVTTMVTAMMVVREREAGTLEQVLVTPIGRTTLVLGKTLPFALVGLFDVGLVLAAGMFLFDVPLRGSLGLVYGGAALYLMTTLGTGLLVSTLARTQQQAVLSAFFFVFPAILLSGFMTPVENMPEWIRPLSYLDPMYYFLRLLRAVMLKGAGLADVARDLAALAILGISILALAVLRFRQRLG